MFSFLKQVYWQSPLYYTKKKLGKSSSKPKECPSCKENDPDQLMQMGEDSIKCMSCCNIFDY